MEANTDIYHNIKSSFEATRLGDFHRYRSWEHCYSFFQNLLTRKDQIDLGALHLAFYLASWGMYRGSSKLLQKDYKIHISIIETLLKRDYFQINEIEINNQKIINSSQLAIFNLLGEIRDVYRNYGVSDTDTLVTKVLLGTYACIPAYDNLLYAGMKFWNTHIRKEKEKRVIQAFGKNSYISLIKFTKEYEEQLIKIQEYIRTFGFRYPLMKLVDMYFWNIGDQTK